MNRAPDIHKGQYISKKRPSRFVILRCAQDDTSASVNASRVCPCAGYSLLTFVYPFLPVHIGYVPQ